MTVMDKTTAVKIAAVALHRAMADDYRGAAGYVARLNHTGHLVTAIVGWIDTMIARTYPGHTCGDPIQVAWLNLPTGQLETADEVQPPMQWAGQLIAARAADDEDGFYALLHAPAEGTELGDGVMALLHIVAASLNNPEAVAASLTGGGQ